jgi:DNA-binding winged helix-turn-helix (wHTH) protein
VPVQPKAFDTLLALVQNSGRVVTKDELMKLIWPDAFVEDSNLTQNIFVLRKTLGETAGEHRFIVTVPGRGYRFAEVVREVTEVDKVAVLPVTIEEENVPAPPRWPAGRYSRQARAIAALTRSVPCCTRVS